MPGLLRPEIQVVPETDSEDDGSDSDNDAEDDPQEPETPIDLDIIDNALLRQLVTRLHGEVLFLQASFGQKDHYESLKRELQKIYQIIVASEAHQRNLDHPL